jgi:serine/threonine protein kinase
MASALRCPDGFYAESGAVSCASCSSRDADAVQCNHLPVLTQTGLHAVVSLCVALNVMNAIYIFRFVRRRVLRRTHRTHSALWLLLAICFGPLVWVAWIVFDRCCHQNYREILEEVPHNAPVGNLGDHLPPVVVAGESLIEECIADPEKDRVAEQLFAHQEEPVVIPHQLVLEWTDNFAQTNFLGAGSFGEVYKAMFTDSSRSMRGLIAIKRLNPSLQMRDRSMDREAAVQAMKREVTVLAEFRHPSIIRLLGYSVPAGGISTRVDNNLTCLAYEFAARGNVASILQNEINASPAALFVWPKRLRLALNVACALNYMHVRFEGRPAYHRDIKSANIVVTECWEGKLIDCGFAKYIPSAAPGGIDSQVVNTTNQIFGTLGYMCPQYCMGCPYDAKADVYSFGIVLAELLTGQLQNPNQGVILQENLPQMDADARAGEWPANVVQAVQRLSLGCTASHNVRISTMAVVVQELRAIVSGNCQETDLDRAHIAEIMQLYRQHQHAVVEEALQVRSNIREQALLLRRQKRDCGICFLDCTVSDGVECRGGHFVCRDCFADQIRSQTSLEERGVFVRNGCSISCAFCHIPFHERSFLNAVSDETFALLRRACNDVSELRAEARVTAEFQIRIEQMRQELLRSQNALANNTHRHRLHVCENILTLKCPRPNCRRAFVDFEGCMALSCNCGCGFCAWYSFYHDVYCRICLNRQQVSSRLRR